MHVAFVTSEMVPYVKTGGLADVSGALPKALVKLGHRVTVVLPRYRQMPFPPGDFAGSVHVPVDAISRSAGFYRTPARRRGRGGVRRAPALLRPRGALRRLRRQPPALRLPRPRRPRVLPEPRRAARRLPRPRLADRPPARLPEGLLLGRPHALPRRPASSPSTTSPTRASSARTPWRSPGAALAPGRPERPGVPRQHQLPEGRGALLRAREHGLAHLRPRDPGAASTASASTACCARAARPLGDPERRRLRRVGPARDARIAKKYSARDLAGKKACKADLLRTFGLPEFPGPARGRR